MNIMTKSLREMAWICMLIICWATNVSAAIAALPEGNAPTPTMEPYFPNRAYEFIWRNWNVTEPERLAAILQTSRQNVLDAAESMGLPPVKDIPPEMRSRGYITLIRRNWHLLPYDQLLTLLDMTPKQLEFALREDDFLWKKLGSLKPKCQALHFVVPDEKAIRRAKEMRRIIETELSDAWKQPEEPRFHFLRQFYTSSTPPSISVAPTIGRRQHEFPRIIYSYCAVYGDPLSNPQLDPYPDELLRQLSALGINGVWLHVVLRDLAPGGPAFPEFGAGHEDRLANLRDIVERARNYGIGVYLYINEPRAMPHAFFHGRNEMAGTPEGEYTALCTSNPTVRKWLADSLAYVFQETPHLAGIFTITASENLTNCASRGHRMLCPHCKNRSIADILAEVNTTMEEGVHRVNPKAKVIIWDWAWADDARDIIARLPKSAWFMSVSEFNLPLSRGGVPQLVREYSMSAAGPGPRAMCHWKAAKEAGLKVMAKVQVNNTWEISTVPYLPVMDLVAQHCRNLALCNVDGLLLSWSLGGYPSPNLEIAARFNQAPTPTISEVLDAVANERYGSDATPLARKAWTAFSNAFQEYPYHHVGLYFSPVHVGPANPLYCEKTNYAATMTGIPYDDLCSWCGPYPVEIFASQFEKLARRWQSGLQYLREAVEKTPIAHRNEAQAELRYAEVAYIHFQSTANQVRFISARNQLAAPRDQLSREERVRLQADAVQCLKSEIELARRLLTLSKSDSRIGFEAANQYFYLPLDLAEKVINCRWLLEHYQK